MCDSVGVMRKQDRAPLSEISIKIGVAIRSLAGARGLTQTAISAAIGRSQPYVSERISLVAPWKLDDLDPLAKLFGQDDGLALMDLIYRLDQVNGSSLPERDGRG